MRVSDIQYLWAHWLLSSFLNSISWHNDSIAYSHLPPLAPAHRFLFCLKPAAIQLKNPLGSVALPPPPPPSTPLRNAHKYLTDNYCTLCKRMEKETARTCLIWMRLYFHLQTNRLKIHIFFNQMQNLQIPKKAKIRTAVCSYKVHHQLKSQITADRRSTHGCKECRMGWLGMCETLLWSINKHPKWFGMPVIHKHLLLNTYSQWLHGKCHFNYTVQMKWYWEIETHKRGITHELHAIMHSLV